MYKSIPNTNIHPSKKDSLKVTYKAEYTDKNENINNEFSNLKEINGIIDLEGLIKVMFELRQAEKYNISIGYIIENDNQWIVEDYANEVECFNGNKREVKQQKQITEQQNIIHEMAQKLEHYEEFIKKFNAEKTFEKFKQQKDNNKYWYELLLRGISPGCQPKDFIDTDHSKGKYGIVAYNRQLTKQELNEYEMREYYN
jgi:hypothetical protein